MIYTRDEAVTEADRFIDTVIVCNFDIDDSNNNTSTTNNNGDDNNSNNDNDNDNEHVAVADAFQRVACAEQQQLCDEQTLDT